MQQLKGIFDTQKRVTSEHQQDAGADLKQEMIRFESAGTSYLVALEKIREITERTTVVPYPEEHARHLGLISLRGEIVPVFTLQPSESSANDDRCIVFEFEPGLPFCLLASNVKKVTIERASASRHKVFQIEGRAASILEADDLAGLIKDIV